MKKLLFLVLLLVMAIPLSAVVAQDDQTIVIRSFGNITTFNPALSNDGASYQAYALLWPAPFGVDSFTGEPVPGLTSWEVSDDGLTYTFTIQPDANWSDGTPISANDMKFVIDAVKSDVFGSVYEPNVEFIEAVNVLDEKTYEVVLTTNNCTILSDLGEMRFLPSHRFAADFSDFESNTLNTNPDISGGPYILEEWVPDEYQAYRANPDFWRGAPGIPFLINRVIGEQAIAVQAIQAGEIDYTYFQGDLFEQIQDRENLQFQAYPQITVNFLSMNWADPTNPQPAYDADGNAVDQGQHPIFSDPLVRQAVAMGYNKQDILDTLGENGGTPLVGVVVPSLGWAYNSEIAPYPYDPEMAAQLLDEAGWVMNESTGIREKEGQPLAFTISYSDILQFFETTVLVAQDQLGDLGFDVQLELVEWANYLDQIYYGQTYDVTAMSNSGGTAPPDPHYFTTLLISSEDVPGSGNNLASYVNPAVDDLIQQGRTVPGCDLEQRADIYYQIQQIAHDDVAYDFTFTPNIYQVANSRINNFNPGPSWVFYGYTDYVHEWTIGE